MTGSGGTVGPASLRAVLILLLAGLLAACVNEPAPQVVPPAPAPSTAATPEPTTVTVGVPSLGAGFNPHLLSDQSPVTTALSTLVLPSVFRPDAEGTLQLDQTIATSARVTSTDPFTVSYELNVQASWTTNAPIAAEDFVYLWDRMRSEPGTVDAAGYRLISDVRSRAGGKAVDVVFSQPYPQWQQLFSGLLPAHILKDAPGSWTGALANGLPASGGPFRIASVDRARGEVVLTRNDLYWASPTTLDRIVLRAVDDSTMVDELRSGDLDAALPESDPTVSQLLAALGPAYRTQQAPQPVVTSLAFRSDTGPLADVRVRHAVAATLDREALRTQVAPGAVAADAFGLAPSEPGYASTAPAGAPARPDPAAAQRLMLAAGYVRDAQGRWGIGGRPLRLVIGAAAERPDDVRLAEAVATQLDAAGIGTTVVAPPAADLFVQPEVPATPPTTTTPTPPDTASGAPATAPPTTTRSPGRATTTAPARTVPSTTVPSTTALSGSTGPPTSTTAPPASGPLRADVMVLPRPVGGDVGARYASDYGCPQPVPGGTTAVAASPTRFCFPALQSLLDGLVAGTAGVDTQAVVERVLWAQLPVLPLYQPVGLVVSTPAATESTDISPGPLSTGPFTGAQRWRTPRVECRPAQR
ncbi:ABC transporter family substrate-binding protein [Pseudonocardia benzenivorans]|uniref:ABC transporter family substrate-binding protein n=1 Tax=Pseudonocardia benzenivorans TaxID=228005 RepID=A0ABW3VR02_9PSEU